MSPLLPLNINSNDKKILASDNLLIYSRSDGFSRRLLQSTLLIDKKFKFQLQLKSLENQKSSGEKFDSFITGHIPIAIKTELEYLIALKNLKKHICHGYGKYMTDIGTNEFKINTGKQIITSHINLILTEEIIEKGNNAEIAFFKLKDILIDWIENYYKALLSL